MKDYKAWMKQKQNINAKERPSAIFHRKEIWWCAIGINIGHEQDGKNAFFERPVLVVQKFSAMTAWIIPLSSKERAGKYYHAFTTSERQHTASLSQLRLVSAKRLLRKIGLISNEDYEIVRRKLVILINENKTESVRDSGRSQ